MKKATILFYSKFIIDALIYLIFFFFSLSFILQLDHLFAQLLTFCLLSIISGCFFIAEFLQYLLKKAIKSLNMDCDLRQAQHYLTKLEAWDRFHSYRHTITIFQTNILRDQNKLDELSKLVTDQENSRLFSSSLDLLQVKAFNLFYLAYANKDKKALEQHYNKLISYQGVKIKGRKVPTLYHPEYIHALYLIGTGHEKAALKVMDNLDLSKMNNRERFHFHYDYYQVCKKLQLQKRMVISKTKCKEYPMLYEQVQRGVV